LLIGGAAERPSEFAGQPHGRTLGVGLTVSAPTGNYRPERVLNAGANRWGFKPELGTTIQRGRWINEIALGVWLFTPNHDGPLGLTLTQDPLASLQFHFSYNFRNGMWLGFDGNFFAGGARTIEGLDPVNRERNSRIGLTLSIPLSRKDSIKLAGHTGAFTRAGTDFNVGLIAYQRLLAGAGHPEAGAQGEE
ncbi:MAG: transporter, partial [Thermoanaerobaculia bacterium]